MHQSWYPPSDEERLVAQCLRGEDTAWEAFFHLYHPRLVTIIKRLMGNQSRGEQAEEIAASVWSSLCSEEYAHLRQYDPQAGRLLTYLAALARNELWKRTRSEKSRHSRECSVARKEADWDDVDRGLAIQEFLATLTRREREFCLTELLRETKAVPASPVSRVNGWKLRSRVLKKFRNYMLPTHNL